MSRRTLGKTKLTKPSSADQLILQDDPNFLPELDLLPVDLGDAVMFTGLESLQSPDTVTPVGSQRQDPSLPDLGGDLMMPPSASSFVGGLVGAGDAYSVRGSGLFRQDEAHGMLEDDLGMQIDADGNLVLEEDFPLATQRQPRAPIGRVDRTDIGSDTASARVRAEHAGGHGAADFVSQHHLLKGIYPLTRSSSRNLRMTVSSLSKTMNMPWVKTKLG